MLSLSDFQPLFPAEELLLAAAAEGSFCRVSGERPSAPSQTNEIRAAFIRFLSLGGDAEAKVHESGVRVQGAYINGRVNLDGTGNVRPLWLENSFISSSFDFFDSRTKVISLDGSLVRGIRGDRAKVDGSLLLRRGFTCEGAVRLSGAEIDGNFSCEAGTVKGMPWKSQRLAIDLSTVTINGSVEFTEGFNALGLVWLDDAEIGGAFDCTRGNFRAVPSETKPATSDPWDRGARAMKCHRLNLTGSLYLRNCNADGEISFTGAEIGGDFDCRLSQFHAVRDGEFIALRFTRVEVGGNVYLSDGFCSFGKVQFNGARLKGNLDCRGGEFNIPSGIKSKDLAAPNDAFSEDALSLVNAVIDGALILAPIERGNGASAKFNGSLDLKSARVPVMVDNESSWPRKALKRNPGELRDVIHLDGFTYNRFAGDAPIDAASRKRWLKCQPAAHLGEDFKPQPFEQVIKVLRDMGHTDPASELAMERERYLVLGRMRWRSGFTGGIRWLAALFWLVFVGFLLGYGYRPFRLVAITAVFALLCGAYFKIAAEQGVFAPRDSQVYLNDKVRMECGIAGGGNWTKCDETQFKEHLKFNPWLFSFDALLPVVDLKQELAWQPLRKEFDLPLWGNRKLTVPAEATEYVLIVEIIFGWLASLLAVAGFSGLVKTDK